MVVRVFDANRSYFLIDRYMMDSGDSMITRRWVLFGGLISALLPRSGMANSTDLVIEVNLPADRWQAGILRLKRANGETLTEDLTVYGKADNGRAAQEGNPARSPVLPFGDTPEGGYSVPRMVSTGSGTAYTDRSYGPNGALVLKPESGDAKVAEGNGRTGLLIHGGDLSSSGKLRATHGCLRLSNADMDRLLAAIREAGNNPVLQRCEVVEVSVLVGPTGVDEPGPDESDPPPGIDALLEPLGLRLN
ncbi:hypothetical protein CDZ97_15465 [Mameliella alba]|uniref:L,D-transpeptidase n=1 Tax=Mameliella alba TaxID=561184 RepID=UPI000B533588|nr:hypothetical protein CDZ95_13985 [Mameliella alba]OWV63460.1 hypothetical protein CDZ97_15465 [Mameliella alba]